MVGTVLAVDEGLKLPQAEAGVQDQVTPRFLESLVTVAAMPAVVLTVIEPGGVKPLVKATLICNGGLLLPLLPPQAARRVARDAVTTRRENRREFTGHLRSQPAC